MADLLHSRREIAEHNRNVRARISALPTFTPEEAKAQQARPITHPYETRLINQCIMLMRVVDDFRDRKVFLVRQGAAIEVWAPQISRSKEVSTERTASRPDATPSRPRTYERGMSFRQWLRVLAARMEGQTA